MIKLRVDDFPGTKPHEFWRHNLDNFKKFDAVLEKHNVNYMIGVIPRWTTEEHIRYFSENKRADVVLHGRYHDERFQNEFRDYETEDEVYQAILLAKARLDVCNQHGICTYIPPHNVIDRKTVNALLRAGFKTLYGGPESDISVLDYAKKNGLYVYRHMPPAHYGRSDEMMQKDVPRILCDFNKLEDIHVSIHWTWEWNIGLQHLDVFLTQIRDIIQ